MDSVVFTHSAAVGNLLAGCTIGFALYDEDFVALTARSAIAEALYGECTVVVALHIEARCLVDGWISRSTVISISLAFSTMVLALHDEAVGLTVRSAVAETLDVDDVVLSSE